ncbi:MAG: hypothetical protein JWQ71_481 [Pedosphaera sp.]|nr:hypothetical protein [Pedosphaera sp.]
MINIALSPFLPNPFTRDLTPATGPILKTYNSTTTTNQHTQCANPPARFASDFTSVGSSIKESAAPYSDPHRFPKSIQNIKYEFNAPSK